MKSRYFDQANLLLKLLPYLHEEPDFALKGGSALNFFVRNLERFSVDIDLTYLPINDRITALKEISSMLERFVMFIQKNFPETKIVKKTIQENNLVKALTVQSEQAFVKIETNLVLRGSVFSSQYKILSQDAQDLFKKNVEVQTLSTPDLYAGKIYAALDRQHPRDLFDIAILLQNEGITEQIRKAFIVYLLSHSRPIIELLNPNRIDISQIYETEFKGMTRIEISLQELNDTREKLINIINDSLTKSERKFILSFKKMKPEWDLFEFDHLKELPAIKWKLYNLSQMDKSKHKVALDKLCKHLEFEFEG